MLLFFTNSIPYLSWKQIKHEEKQELIKNKQAPDRRSSLS